MMLLCNKSQKNKKKSFFGWKKESEEKIAHNDPDINEHLMSKYFDIVDKRPENYFAVVPTNADLCHQNLIQEVYNITHHLCTGE